MLVCSGIHVLGSPLMSAEATRMQDLASEFSKKISRGNTPDPHSRRGRPPHLPTTSAGHKRPGVGTQILVPLNFSAVVAPLHHFQGQKVKVTRPLLTTAFTHQAAAAVTVGTYSPWKPTATLRSGSGAVGSVARGALAPT